MSAITDIIELLIGFYAIPAVVLFSWIFVAGYLGISNFYLSLIGPIFLLILLSFIAFRFRRLIAYGLILSLIMKLVEGLLIYLPSISS